MAERRVNDELAFLVGAATGPEQVHASAWGPAYAARTDVLGRIELGGALVILTQQELRTDGTGFKIVNVFMRDPSDDALLLYAFDTVGYPPDPPARGRWDGDVLILDRTTARGTGRTSFRPTNTGFTWSKEFRGADQAGWQQVVSAELTKAERPGG